MDFIFFLDVKNNFKKRKKRSKSLKFETMLEIMSVMLIIDPL